MESGHLNGTSGGNGTAVSAADGRRPDRYKWIALSNTTLSMTMATIDASIVIIAMPAIFRGIHLNPLDPGNISYLLWMIIGYLLVQSVLVVTLGRLGDMFGRVKIYNLGFVVFTLASIALSLDPLTGAGGALWLIGWRFVQAFGGAMLMANSAAILTDAFPANKRGMALGVNQIAGISGQFVGLLLGGLLAAWDWRLVFWVNVPIGLFGTVWAYKSLREIATTRRARIDWIGNVMFVVGLGALLVAITYGIQPYGGHPTGWTNPWIIAGLVGGAAVLVAVLRRRDQDRRADVPDEPVQDPGRSRPATWPACSARSPAAGCSSCWSSGWPASGCRCTATTSRSPRCGPGSTCCRSPRAS